MEPRSARHTHTSKKPSAKPIVSLLLVLIAVVTAASIAGWVWLRGDSAEEKPVASSEANADMTEADMSSGRTDDAPDSPPSAEEEPAAPPLSEAEQAALEAEQARLAAVAAEAAYYATPESADAVMGQPFIIMPQAAYPGDVVLVRSQQEGELEWQGKSYSLQSFETGYYTYIPIPIQSEPGSYALGDASLTVLDKTFDSQRLEVSEEQNSIRQNTERIAEDQKLIDAARASSEPTFLFSADSPFMLPAEGRLTTPFGFTRYVNGAYAGSHTAIDIAAPEGTPVVATQSGIVALAANFYLTGNTIYIDHGMGLFSQYAHLSELQVETGDEVEVGEGIGLIGSTGFSTGPHLHFTFWAHNVPVNPNLFLDRLPFHWLEAGDVTAAEPDPATASDD